MENLTIFILVLTIINKGAFESDHDCFVAPHVCPNENVTFWLVTRNTTSLGDEIQLFSSNIENLQNYITQSNILIKMIVHGFKRNHFSDFNIEMQNALLTYGEFYVINIDWEVLAAGSNCRQEASKNVQVVANCTAQLLTSLVENLNYPPENIHLVGLSLGGQIVGLVQQYLPNNLKLHHVTGLDPTLPYFEAGIPQLTANSANFVDVIHTASGTRSQFLPRGDVDFYVNGGFEQPGCFKSDIDISENGSLFQCSHSRSYQYYVESINTKIGFYSTKIFGDSNETILMGYHVPYGVSGVYYVKTHSEYPFAMGKE